MINRVSERQIRPKIGSLAYSSDRKLGVIGGHDGFKWWGFHLSKDLIGHRWESVKPRVIGHIRDIKYGVRMAQIVRRNQILRRNAVIRKKLK